MNVVVPFVTLSRWGLKMQLCPYMHREEGRVRGEFCTPVGMWYFGCTRYSCWAWIPYRSEGTEIHSSVTCAHIQMNMHTCANMQIDMPKHIYTH